MLKIQRPTAESLKCGEVFLLKAEYLISCSRCQELISFDDFQRHFQNLHLTPTEQMQLQILFEASVSDDPISTDSIVESGFINEDEADYKIPDDHPILIDDIIQGKSTITGSANNESDSSDDFEPLEPGDYSSSEEDSMKGTSQAFDKKVSTDDDFKPLEAIGSDVCVSEKGSLTAFKEDSSDDDFEPLEPEVLNDDIASSSSSKPIEETFFPCTFCERKFKSKRNLGDHLRRIHKKYRNTVVPKKPGIDPAFKCQICGDSFCEEIQLKRHDMTKHTGVKCDICGKSYSHVNAMETHRKRHTGVRDFKCDDCGKEFFTKKERYIHSLTHTRNYRKVCEICGKPCTDGGALTAHMRRHTGERPFKCKVCGKGFFSGYDRNIHESSHSDERPFECDICGRAFRYKRAVRVHKKIHVKERNFPCHICDKRFINEKGVKEHMRSHTKTLVEKEEENNLMDETRQKNTN